MRLFRRSGNKRVVERLYEAVVAAARQPALYRDFGVPDTFEGRFECLSLHAVLVCRRLGDAPPPGPELAQKLVDAVFAHFDRTLREMGVGDTVVPKRMRTLAEAYLGRGAAYGTALNERGTLAGVLARNVYGGQAGGEALARYVEAAAAGLCDAPLQMFLEGEAPFPDAAAFAELAPRPAPEMMV